MSLKDQVLDRYVIELDKRASEVLKAPLRQLWINLYKYLSRHLH